MSKGPTLASLFLVVTLFAAIVTAWYWPIQNYCKSAGGAKYCIPVEYFILPPIDETGFLVRVRYPDMTPAPRAVDAINILVDDADSYFIASDIAYQRKENNPISAEREHGLLLAPPKSQGGDMLYYEPMTRPNKHQPSVIRCSGDLSVDANASCRHRFVVDKRAFIIRYPRSLLQHWKNIQLDAIQLIDSFRQ